MVLVVCLPRYRTPLALIVEKIAVPACVACSIALGSFPNNTPLFLVGAASVFAPLIFMGVYAGALFAVVSKGDEFPSAFAVGEARSPSETGSNRPRGDKPGSGQDRDFLDRLGFSRAACGRDRNFLDRF